MDALLTIFLLCVAQLTIEASDQALPDDRVTVATVVVTVPRDRTPPRFNEAEITARVAETRNIGDTIAQFRARDDNVAVSRALHVLVLPL